MLFDWLIVGQAFTAGLPASYTFSALIYAATWNGSISTSRKHPVRSGRVIGPICGSSKSGNGG
jgi:hypothetical protein